MIDSEKSFRRPAISPFPKLKPRFAGASLNDILSSTFLKRMAALGSLLTFELLVLSIWFDNERLARSPGIASIVGYLGAWVVRFVVGFAGLFAMGALYRYQSVLQDVSCDLDRAPLRWRLLSLHFVFISFFVLLSRVIYANVSTPNSLVFVWLSIGTVACASALFAFLPIFVWRHLFSKTHPLWLLALAAVSLGCLGGSFLQALWPRITGLTLTTVHLLLGPIIPGIFVDQATMLVGTPKFSVIISNQCSGIEGIGLILAFTTLWLILFHAELRLPNSLVLLPVGVILMFFMNVLRISILIAIGNSGAPQMALGGFHSQAGWIAFSAVAILFTYIAGRVPWLLRQPVTRSAVEPRNPTAAFLMPLLATLAAAMIGTAFSSNFEWLYPARIIAAAAALCAYRKYYKELNLEFTWFGPSAGVIAFAIWIALDRAKGLDVIPSLSNNGEVLPYWWLIARLLGAIVTVPIVEELAFRGYLNRRFVATDFESVPFTRFIWTGVVASSVLFGLLHNDRWLAGTLVGLIYSAACIRRGNFADAVIAHAVTNSLIAIDVLAFGKWHLW